MKKKILIVLIMFLSTFLLTSCKAIEQAFASFIMSIGNPEKNYEFVEGTFESDEVWYLTKEFEVEREDGTIESFKELKITRTKITITRIEERQKLNYLRCLGNGKPYLFEMYIQPENEEYVQLIFKQDSQANLENFYGGYAYLDNYYHEKVYFDFAFEYNYKEKTYKFYPKRSWYNCWEIDFNGKIKNGEFLENEKGDIIFKINNNGEENKEEQNYS